MDRNEIMNLKETSFRFAAEHIAHRHDLQTMADFPLHIWQAMGKAGLFKIGIEKDFGGTGGGYLALATAGEAMVRGGRNMGLALSWLYQQLVARFLFQQAGNAAQKKQYLKPMAEGKLIVSFAVSEPKHGPHPKHLSAFAKQNGPGYIITGEKTYLTNGPIANLYIVIAVTEEGPPRKRFTAFLIPGETNGLTLTAPMNLPFLKPAPHGGIVLASCLIPETAILGERNAAYEAMVIPFGEIEDTVMMGLAIGAMSGQRDILVDVIHRQGREVGEALHGKLGTLTSVLEALRTIAYEAACRLDRNDTPSVPLIISFNDLAAMFQSHLEEITNHDKINLPAAYHQLREDLLATAAIRKRSLQIKREKIGRSLLQETL